MGFVNFMASASGRWLRAVAGIALIAIGYAMHSPGGSVIAIVGLLPLLAGAFDFCVFAPLLGAPLSGKEIRSSQRRGA
jgi:vacuolar-type H+-ATPase subunit I/STV1